MPDSELQLLHVSPDHVRRKASELGVEWYQLPIPDAGKPDEGLEHLWADAGVRLRALLKDGHNIVIHCKGGLGRTGTITARLLIEFGVDHTNSHSVSSKGPPWGNRNSLQERYVRGRKVGR